jgi:hypothetical protein
MDEISVYIREENDPGKPIVLGATRVTVEDGIVKITAAPGEVIPGEGAERHTLYWIQFEAKKEDRWFVGYGYSDKETEADALATAELFWQRDSSEFRIREKRDLIGAM